MRIIGRTTGGESFLVEVAEGRGRVIRMDDGTVGPEVSVESIVQRGYWESYQPDYAELEVMDGILSKYDLELDLDTAAQVKKFDPDQRRDRNGRWTDGAPGDVSLPDFPTGDYVPPPPPRGDGSLSPAGSRRNYDLGALGERIAERYGLRNFNEPGKPSPIDMHHPELGYGFEVKLWTTRSAQYKVRLTNRALNAKRMMAEERNLRPATMAVIYDEETREAHVYWRPGFGSWRLGPDWNYLGTEAA